MRTAISFGGVLMLALLVVGCDSSDPAQVETQILTISMNANGSTADTYNVWDMIVDNDGDNQPDDGETYLWCENSFNQTLNPITLPWTFSAQIDLIPAGTTTKARISSANAVSASYNVANYDTLVRLNTQSAKPPLTEGGNTYRFFEPRKQPSVNESISFATFNPLSASRGNPFATSCPGGNTKTRCGLCARQNSGLARIDGVDVGGVVECSDSTPERCEMPWTVVFNKGDTIVFQSRIAEEAQIGVGLREVVNQAPNSLSATVEVDGREVSLRGVANGPALSFSFTSR